MWTLNIYDVVTLGETMIRFAPPDFKRFEQTISFNVEIEGSESNLAIGLALLDHYQPSWRVGPGAAVMGGDGDA